MSWKKKGDNISLQVGGELKNSAEAPTFPL